VFQAERCALSDRRNSYFTVHPAPLKQVINGWLDDDGTGYSFKVLMLIGNDCEEGPWWGF
jgi:hypothetical protein